MRTTTLFVELLLGGIAALVWLLGLAALVFGFDWFCALAVVLEKAKLLVAFLALGLAYSIGVMLDEVADRLCREREFNIAKDTVQTDLKNMSREDLCSIVASSLEKHAHLDYMRRRIRILRSSVINASLITVVALALIWIRVPAAEPKLLIFVSVVGGVGAVAFWFTYQQLLHSFWRAVDHLGVLRRVRQADRSAAEKGTSA